MEKLKLAAPWTTFYREIETLFAHDSEIKTIFDEDNASIKIYVNNNAKADSLANILPLYKSFGDIEIKIEVISPNDSLNLRIGYTQHEYDFETAFEGNKVFNGIITITDGLPAPFTFVQFNPEIAQFYNDNLSSTWGLASMLYEDIARDIFDLPGVFFSTVKVDK